MQYIHIIIRFNQKTKMNEKQVSDLTVLPLWPLDWWGSLVQSLDIMFIMTNPTVTHHALFSVSHMFVNNMA